MIRDLFCDNFNQYKIDHQKPNKMEETADKTLNHTPFNYKVNSKLQLTNSQKIKSYYKNFECTICYETPLKPIRCKKCKQIFCLQCVTAQKEIQNICAFRCKGKFEIEKCQQFTPTFQCPCSQFCQQEIIDYNDIVKHAISCKLSTPTLQSSYLNKQEFKCTKGLHQLEFFTSSYEQMNQNNCSLCEQKNVVRACCRVCNEKLCLKCRPLFFDKKQCPIGHKLQKMKGGSSSTCDICSLTAQYVGDFIYHDICCNFGLCQLCYEDLPQKREQIKLIANQPQFCSKSRPADKDQELHRLKTIKDEEQTVCKLCQQEKNCPKKCQQCSERYCLKCKPFLAFTDQFCQDKHRITKYQNQLEQKCDKCLKMIQKEVYWDEECSIKLCNSCLISGVKILRQRARIDHLFCPQDHPVMILASKRFVEVLHECDLCQRPYPFKLVCPKCIKAKQVGRYCFSCFSQLDKKMCSLGHNLIHISGNDYMKLLEYYREKNPEREQFLCQHCCKDIKEKQMQGCYICGYHVCCQCAKHESQKNAEQKKQ